MAGSPPMQVFVTGATGALGRPTCRALVAAGHRVRGVARGPAKADAVRADGAEPIEVSLFDPRALREALAGCDAVLHFATKVPSPWPRHAAQRRRERPPAARCLALPGGCSVGCERLQLRAGVGRLPLRGWRRRLAR